MEEAEFVLAHGTEALGAGDGMEPTPISLEEIKEILRVAAAKNLPLLIANPDVVTVDKSYLRLMPGMFGRWYSEMGGKVSQLEGLLVLPNYLLLCCHRVLWATAYLG